MNITTTMTNAETFNDILEPLRDGRTYEQIAIRASDWLRLQGPSGYHGIRSMTSEQARKIFLDLVTQPKREYLEALAAVIPAPLEPLLVVAGYAQPPLDKRLEDILKETKQSGLPNGHPDVKAGVELLLKFLEDRNKK